MSVQWEQLVYFRSVARLEHVSRAADELGVTQPALSRAIARLEREIGSPLFERHGRAIRLTRNGLAFLRQVERALDAIETGRRDVLELVGADAERVSLGFLRTLGAAFVPQLVRSFTTAHPNVRFTFAQNNGAALEAMLLARDVAMILTIGPLAQRAIRWERVTSQRFVLIVPSAHRFAARRVVKLADLRDDTFLTFKPGHAIREFTDALCRRAGFEPRIAFEAEESNSIRGFVNAGFGVALVPQTGTADELSGIRIADTGAKREVGIAWLADRQLTLAERAFHAFVVRARHTLSAELRPS